jgi:hypothetical protein
MKRAVVEKAKVLVALPIAVSWIALQSKLPSFSYLNCRRWLHSESVEDVGRRVCKAKLGWFPGHGYD